jgi:signal transduction histidine kinase
VSGARGTIKGALILFAIGLATWAVGLHGIWAGPGWRWTESVPDTWHLVTLAAATSAVLLQRAHLAIAFALGAAAAVADAALGGSVGVMIVFWELLFRVGLSGSVRMRRVVTGAVTAVVVGGTVAALIIESDLQLGIVTGFQLALLAIPLWWADNVRQKTELADLEAQRAADLERIGELRRTEAVQAERSAIARDLHDAIASRLSTIAIQSAAGLATPERDQSAIMRTVRAQSLEALQEMRSMIVVLRSELDRSTASTSAAGTSAVVMGSLEHLDELVTSARSAGLRVHADVPSRWTDTTALPVAVGQACFRIVQEALANAIKHAPESEVRVAVSGDGAEVRVLVENSFTTSAAVDHPTLSAGTGLVTMRERVEALGGRFRAGRDETASVWHVEAKLPVSAAGSGERAGTRS